MSELNGDDIYLMPGDLLLQSQEDTICFIVSRELNSFSGSTVTIFANGRLKSLKRQEIAENFHVLSRHNSEFDQNKDPTVGQELADKVRPSLQTAGFSV